MDEIKLYMEERLVWIDAGKSATEAAKMMRDNHIGSLLIKEKEFYVGIVTEGDITRKAIAEERSPDKVTVNEIKTEPVFTMDCNCSMEDAVLEMNKRKIRHIAITNRGRHVGMLSMNDFAAYYTRKYK